MVLVNVASVAAWALATVAARRGRLLASYVLATAEFLAHLVLVWVFVGWGFGMQYFLIFAAAGLQLFGAVLRLRVRIVLTVLMMSLFVAGFYYTELTAPVYEVPAGPLAAVNILNIALVFALTSGAVGYTGALADRAEAALATEHARSERLLTNVLPVPIAERLKEHEEVIADGVDGASVLFADIVGFTTLSAQRSPDEIVAMLNGVFTRLDALVDEFGLEKIKTIGDAYMVASGIPTSREDHAQVLARFALAARDELAEHNLTGGRAGGAADRDQLRARGGRCDRTPPVLVPPVGGHGQHRLSDGVARPARPDPDHREHPRPARRQVHLRRAGRDRRQGQRADTHLASGLGDGLGFGPLNTSRRTVPDMNRPTLGTTETHW